MGFYLRYSMDEIAFSEDGLILEKLEETFRWEYGIDSWTKEPGVEGKKTGLEINLGS